MCVWGPIDFENDHAIGPAYLKWFTRPLAEYLYDHSKALFMRKVRNARRLSDRVLH
jgi:hypothetical protein